MVVGNHALPHAHPLRRTRRALHEDADQRRYPIERWILSRIACSSCSPACCSSSPCLHTRSRPGATDSRNVNMPFALISHLASCVEFPAVEYAQNSSTFRVRRTDTCRRLIRWLRAVEAFISKGHCTARCLPRKIILCSGDTSSYYNCGWVSSQSLALTGVSGDVGCVTLCDSVANH